MTAHTESHAFEQHRSWSVAYRFCKRLNRPVCFKNIVSIDLHTFNAVTNCFIHELPHAKLFAARCGKSVAIVFNNEDDGQVPNCSYIYTFMKIPFARAAITAEYCCYPFIFL